MGWFDKLRAEFIDIIEWVDDTNHTLVWRFPRYHNQIKNGAQLIVRPGQVAVFVHEGKLADVFEPGTYELTITSTRPTRFTVATGQKEQFGTEVANYQRRSLDAVAAWYEAPPPAPAPTSTVGPTTTVPRPPAPSSSTTSSEPS